jgi:hypothetical protein
MKLFRFFSALVFLLFAVTVATSSAFFLFQEINYQTLKKQLRVLSQNENSYTSDAIEKDVLFYDGIFARYGSKDHLSKLSSLYALLSASKNTDTSRRSAYEKRAVELQEAAIAKSPLDGHLWLKLAFLYRSLDYPRPRIVKTLTVAHQVAPFSPYYAIPRIKIYIDYWSFISPEMQRDMEITISKMLDENFYGLLTSIGSQKYSDFILALDLYKNDPDKDAFLKNTISWYRKTGVIK